MKPVTRTLARGLGILEIVAASPHGVAVGDVAAAAALDKGTTSRLLSALHQLGYLRQHPTDRRYLLSGKVLVLSRNYDQQFNLREAAHPHVVALRDTTQETVHLAVREGQQLVYVDQVEPDRSVRLASVVGQSLPLHVTAMGRAVLAALLPAESEQMIRLLMANAHFAHFVMDLDHVREEVEHARRTGWATVERDDDVTRVGAAIVDATGQPVGALSVSGPAYRVDDHVDALGARCVETSRAISVALGG